MGRFFVRFFLTVLVIVLLISTTALAVLFIVKTNDYTNSQNELSKTKEDLNTAQSKVIELQGQATGTSSKYKFSDTGLGINGEFPTTWNIVSDTKVELNTDTTTTTLKSVKFTLSKNGTTLSFIRQFGPMGDLGVAYPSSTYDVKVVNSEIIRVADKGTNIWTYLAKIDCSEAIDVPAGSEVCGSGSFFPGFGTAQGSASFAGADVKDTALLEEIDAIVISTLN